MLRTPQSENIFGPLPYYVYCSVYRAFDLSNSRAKSQRGDPYRGPAQVLSGITKDRKAERKDREELGVQLRKRDERKLYTATYQDYATTYYIENTPQEDRAEPGFSLYIYIYIALLSYSECYCC